jgi:hypothetical protein
VPFQQAHLDAVTIAANELTAAKAQHDAAKARLAQTLEQLAPGFNEGDIRCLSGRVPAVVKKDGVMKFVMIPGLLDSE